MRDNRHNRWHVQTSNTWRTDGTSSDRRVIAFRWVGSWFITFPSVRQSIIRHLEFFMLTYWVLGFCHHQKIDRLGSRHDGMCHIFFHSRPRRGSHSRMQVHMFSDCFSHPVSTAIRSSILSSLISTECWPRVAHETNVNDPQRFIDNANIVNYLLCL